MEWFNKDWFNSISEGINLIGLGILSLVSGVGLPKYFQEKAKNFATKGDIGSITKIVESAKAEYALKLEEFKTVGQLEIEVPSLRIDFSCGKPAVHKRCIGFILPMVKPGLLLWALGRHRHLLRLYCSSEMTLIHFAKSVRSHGLARNIPIQGAPLCLRITQRNYR